MSIAFVCRNNLSIVTYNVVLTLFDVISKTLYPLGAELCCCFFVVVVFGGWGTGAGRFSGMKLSLLINKRKPASIN